MVFNLELYSEGGNLYRKVDSSQVTRRNFFEPLRQLDAVLSMRVID